MSDSRSIESLTTLTRLCRFDGFLLTFPKLPSYLKSVNYVRPTDVASAPVGYAMNFAGTVFEYMQLNPHFGQSLDLTLKGYAEYRGSWLDVYPSELLLQGAEHLQTLVVDVGGGLVRLRWNRDSFFCCSLTRLAPGRAKICKNFANVILGNLRTVLYYKNKRTLLRRLTGWTEFA